MSEPSENGGRDDADDAARGEPSGESRRDASAPARGGPSRDSSPGASESSISEPAGAARASGTGDAPRDPSAASGRDLSADSSAHFRSEALTDAPPLACPACERLVAEPNARFCAACGHRFASPSLERVEERSTAADPLVGRTLADRYRIEEVIGRGGMGVVYRIEHTRIGKAMAMKLLHGDLARDREVVRRFRREAEAVSKLDHSNTVQVFDFGQSEGMTYLIMELLGGEDLGLILHVEGTIPFARIAHVTAQVCGSVQQAHDRGIVHRDLKPENIRILHDRSTPDFVKVLDFGLAKLRESSELGGASITRQGLLVGTPYYMAPEQIRGERSDHRVDIYAMGCVLYKAIVGVPPFWASTPVGVLTKHITDEPIAPSIRSPRRDLPDVVDEIVLRAMAKDPAARYQTMRELRDDLEAYLREHQDELATTSRPSLPPSLPTTVPSGHELTQPIALPRRPAAPRPVVAATRDEVERYERRLRAQSVAMWSGTALAIAGGAVGGYYLWTHRAIVTAPLATTESEPNDGPGQENLLRADAPLSAHVGARLDETHGDVDVYEIDVPAGVEAIALRASELPNLDLAIDVFTAGRSDPMVVIDAMPLGGPESAPNLPLGTGRYLVRVHEVREGGRHPVENVSDTYTISWSPVTPAAGDEREWNDGPSQAEALALEGGHAERRGFIGWNDDADTYCLPAESNALTATVSAIPSLDLVLESIVDGRESTANAGARGDPETLPIRAGETPRRVCVRVSAAAGAQRGDASTPYVLQVTRGDGTP